MQYFLPGRRAGKRVLKGVDIIDDWKVLGKKIVPKILRALAGVHRIKMIKFGWPTVNGGKFEGKFRTARDFFQANYLSWIKEIRKADRRLSLQKISSLDKHARGIIELINYDGPAVLVHGDAINPSNILVHKNKISLLDWEWSIAMDPAWEFADLGWWKMINKKDLALYFKAAGINKSREQDDFIKRVRLYIPLWLLWGTYMHANDKNLNIYLALRKLMVEKMP